MRAVVGVLSLLQRSRELEQKITRKDRTIEINEDFFLKFFQTFALIELVSFAISVIMFVCLFVFYYRSTHCIIQRFWVYYSILHLLTESHVNKHSQTFFCTVQMNNGLSSQSNLTLHLSLHWYRRHICVMAAPQNKTI